MSEEKLLPCPLCGGEPELHWLEEAGEVLTAWVSCKCGCEHHERLTKEVAVKKWNSRHLPNDAQTPLNREQIAQIIYDAFPFEPRHGQAQKPAWLPGGNSLMQDEARCAAERILLSRFPCVAAEAPEIDRLRAVFEAAYGLCCGYDWNCGTAAIAAGYRRKLLSAVNAIKEVPDFDGKYRDYGPSVSSAMREGK